MKNLKLNYSLLFRAVILFLFVGLPLKVFAISVSPSPPKTVYLTFDGDMDPVMKKVQEEGKVKEWYDPALFTYLEKNNIPSTFFLGGMFAQMYPDLVKTLATNPNFSIQNHTWSHAAFEPNCYHLFYITNDQQKKAEIEKAQTILTSLVGKAPTYFRYAGLCHDAHDDTMVKEEGLLLVPGEFSSGDTFLKTAKAIVKNILTNIRRGNNVVVLHVGSKLTPKTTIAVEKLVPKLEKLGYALRKLLL